MYHPTDRERLYLDWAVSCGIYSPSFFSVDHCFVDVWLRVYRSLDVRVLGYDRYWDALTWLYETGYYLLT